MSPKACRVGTPERAAISVREFSFHEEFAPFPELTEREIHLWHRKLFPGEAGIAPLRSLLSEDELERAQRFRFDPDRHEFIHSRGTLRTLLGAYLRVPPEVLRFAYNSYARPMLTGFTNLTELDFNVSHSGGVTLWAFALGRKVGVDVEKARCDFSTLEIADRFFSASEQHTLRALPAEQRHEAFFRCWTRKESFIKALGEGLSHPLNQFDVTLAPGAQAQLLATRPDAKEATRWAMWDIAVPDGYTAALTAGLS
ncbi:MAG TPA: 4'-phosphopantetheinyl transferase superfamily protein [Candidatus Angelobacter sp.]|nr:4'-phosphopantetheinyl transferase superfamily protein [Candidatus Angelobacter sp.]